MALPKTKSWFLDRTSTPNKRGSRLTNGDRPNEQTFTELLKASIFKSETADRAKEDDGTELSEISGHVVLATDEQAKANQSKKYDRSVVAQASQLPTSKAESSESFSFKKEDNSTASFTDETLSVSIESGISSRNSYIHKWSQAFSTFFGVVIDELNKVIAKAKTNASAIVGLASRLTTLENIVDPTGGIPGVLPIGSTTWHANPSSVSDSDWKPLDGITEVSKWITPDDQSSGESTIYTMLKTIYTLAPGSNTNYFKLPNFNKKMLYQEDEGLGFGEGEWGGVINKEHLPNHKHESNFQFGGSLTTSSAGSHNHDHSWSGQLPTYVDGSGNAGGSGNTFLKQDFQKDTSLTIGDNGSHNHLIEGKTGDSDVDWGGAIQNKFLFEPPRVLGGFLIKVS